MSVAFQTAGDRDRLMVRAFKRAVIVSLVAHVLVLGGLVIMQGVNFLPKRRPPVIGVNFYAPPGGKKGGGDKKKTTVPVKKPETKKPETKKPEVKKPEVKKPEVKKPETKKEEKKEVKKETKPEDKKKEIAKNDIKKDETKPEKKDEPKKEETKDEKLEPDKKPEEKPEDEKPEETKPEETKPEDDLSNDIIRDMESDEDDSGDEGSGPSDVEGPGDSPFDGAMNGVVSDPILAAYFGKIMEQILEVLRIPPSVPVGRDLKVDVYIYVDADGNVLEYKVEALSGNKALDNAVTTMLDELKTLPAPPPEKMDGDRFELPIRFEPGG